MARNFNIVATLQLRGPNNIRGIVNQIQKQLNGINANVNINIANSTTAKLNTLNSNLSRVNATLINITRNAGAAAAQLQALAAAITSVRTAGTSLKVTTNVTSNMASNIANATDNMHAFGEQAALAVRRFAAFAGPTAVIFGLIAAIKEGFSAAFEFEKEMIRLSQVTGKSVGALGDLSREITRLATGLGTSSKDLGNIATTLAQAGLSAKDTKVALEALARSSLAATFTDIENTTEGAIAVFRQFNVEAEDLQGVIGSLNAVSAAFAAESDDLVSVIRRTGGAFKASGGSLNELLGLFTSVRSTTRESADSIATGFRTIFTRIQRPRTIQYLKELGINLTDVDNRFIGPLESVRRLNAALSQIETNDPRFSAIIEELGGFRQVSKVIPLIQQFPEALKAITVAQEGQLSIVEDSETAQKSLANQLAKVREEFFSLFREITDDKSFRVFAETSLDLARALIEITRSLKPLIPLLVTMGTLNIGKNLPSFAGGFLSGLGKGTKKFAKGGFVPGSGSGDTVPAMLTPGEFVLRKDVAQSIGKDELNRFNKFAVGGEAKKKKSAAEIRQARVEKSFKLPGVQQFGLAALRPVGSKEFVDRTVPFNIRGESFAKDVQIKSGGLTQPFADQSEDLIKRRLARTATTVARGILGDLGAKAPNESQAKQIVNNAGFTAAVGSVFESALGIAGAPFDAKPDENFPIDFPGGLGTVAQKFGLPQGIPTDATRTSGSKGKSISKYVGQIERYFAKTMGGDPDVKAELARQAGIAQKKDVAAPRDIGSRLSILSDGDKGKIASALAGNRPGGGISGILSKVGASESEIAAYVASNPTALAAAKAAKALPNIKGPRVRKAKGGDIAGDTDTVPAMLTPGEFVFNKKAAARIGIKNLEELNSTKVQKFANGGTVGNKSGGISGQGAFIGISVISALVSTMDNLNDSTQKALTAVSSFAVAVTGMSFLIQSAVSEERLQSFAKPQKLVGGSRALTHTTAALAQNFDKVAIGSAVVAAGFNIFGDHLKAQGKALADNAKTMADVNKAIALDNQGALAKGVGTGAGVGALAGTLIAPGLGTVIGTVAGGIIGAAIAPFFADTENIVKTFKQNQFDKVGELLSGNFDEINSGKFSFNSRAASIGASLGDQRRNVLAGSDDAQRKELSKQFRAEISNIQTFGTKIAETVGTIEEFESSFGGAGKETITTLAFLTKKTYPEVRKAIEAEIKSLVSAKEAQEALKKSSKDFAGVLIGIAAFSEAVQRASDSIAELSSEFDTVASSIGGGTSGGKFTGTNGLSSSFFERAAGGKITSDAAIKSNIKQITDGLIDDTSREEINRAVSNVSSVARELPNVLERTSARAGFGEDSDDVESVFKEELSRALPHLSDGVTSVLTSAFAAQVASRTGTGDAGFRQELRKDPQAIVDKILNVLGPDSIKELDGAIKVFQDQINTLADRVATASKLELEISKRRVDLEKTKLDFEQNLARNGDTVSTARTREVFAAQQSALLSGTGVGGGAAEIAAALDATLKERRGKETERQSAPFAEQGKFVKEIGVLNDKSARLRSALENLASSTLVLSNLQAKLAKEEENRSKRASLSQDLLFGGGEGRVEFARVANALKGITEGKFSLGEIPAKMQAEVINLLNKLPDAKSGLLGGKTPTDFLEEETNKEFRRRGFVEGADAGAPADLKDKTIRGGSAEAAILEEIKVAQTDMLTAQSLLIAGDDEQLVQLKRLNDTSLVKFSKDIVDAVNQIGAASAATRINSIETAKLDKGAISKQFNELAKILSPESIDADFTGGENAVRGNALFKQAKSVEAFSKEIEAARAADAKTKALIGFQPDKSTLAGAPQSKDFGLGQTKLHRAEASQKAVNDFIAENGLNQIFPDTLALTDKLKSSLEKTATTNGEAMGGLAGKDDKFTNQEEFNKIIRNRLVRALAEFRAEALGTSDKIRNKNLAPVKERFGEDLTQTLLEGDNFEQIINIARSLSQEMGNSVEPASRLVEQIRNLNTELAKVQAGAVNFEKKAGGGAISGPGTSRSDSILARLSTGEFVIRAAAASKIGVGALNHMNSTGTIPGFAKGGPTRKDLLAKNKARFKAFKAFNKERFQSKFKKKTRSGGPGKPFIVFNPDDPLTVGPFPDAFGLGGPKPPKAPPKRSPHLIFSPDRLRKEEAAKAAGAAGIRALSGTAGAAAGGLGALASSGAGAALGGLSRLKKFSEAARRIPVPVPEKEKDVIKPNRARKVRGFANGGLVPGFGAGDSVPAMLTPGEFVLNRATAKRFANGGIVKGPNGTGGSPGLTLSPEALSNLSKFSTAANALGSAISAFGAVGQTLSSALTNWTATANKLAEAMLSMPSEINVTHSPIVTTVNVAGIEGLERSIQDKVLAAVDARLGAQTARAADGKNPFLASSKSAK